MGLSARGKVSANRVVIAPPTLREKRRSHASRFLFLTDVTSSINSFFFHVMQLGFRGRDPLGFPNQASQCYTYTGMFYNRVPTATRWKERASWEQHVIVFGRFPAITKQIAPTFADTWRRSFHRMRRNSTFHIYTTKGNVCHLSLLHLPLL